jgi:hypothetical protein
MMQGFRPELLEVAVQYAEGLRRTTGPRTHREPPRRLRSAVGRGLVRIGERLAAPVPTPATR